MNNSSSVEEEQPESPASTWKRFTLLWRRVWVSMRSRVGTGEERPQRTSAGRKFSLLWKRVLSSMRFRSDNGEDQPQHGPGASPSPSLTDNVQTPGISDPIPQCAGQDQEEEKPMPEDQLQDGSSSLGSAQEHGKEEEHKPENHPQDGPSLTFSGPPVNTEGNEKMVITSIRATDVALGLRRLSAGFYIIVHHSDLEWRTENKCTSVNDDVVEWAGPIPIPSDPSATVCIQVYASFEFQPMLGTGEQLREMSITVKELLDDNAKHVPFTLFPKDGDVVSPCSSILVIVERQNYDSNSGDSSVSRISAPRCSISESQGEPEYATYNGHCALSRYRKRGEKQDLEHSIREFERALHACPMDHPCHAAAQANLAMAKFILCRIEDSDMSLEIPLSLYRNALTSRPVGHLDRPSTLVRLAMAHVAQFEKRKDEAEVAQAESFLHEAIRLSSTASHEKQVATFMLQLHAGRTVQSIQADGKSSTGQALGSRSVDEDPFALSAQLLRQFGRLGNLDYLQQAIAILERLMGTTPVSDSRYRAVRANLGVALLYRFNHVGEMRDLDGAVSTLRNAVDLTPHRHPDRPGYLSNLGTSLVTRFQHLGEMSDLGHAISVLRDAVELIPTGHPNKPACLLNLGRALNTRFAYLGELSDIQDAISTLRDAINLTPNDHPHKPNCLNILGDSLRARFEHLGEPTDLNEAISRHRDAVNLIPVGHPSKPASLNDLGNALATRFERFGELGDLEDAISFLKDGVELTPHSHRHMPSHLNNLATCFTARFARLGEPSDLEEAISRFRNAAKLIPTRHPNRPQYLSNLGTSFVTRFERHGELSDLKDAISSLREAVDLMPNGHPHKPICLNNLGNCLATRFVRVGELSDLGLAISVLRDAVDLSPDGHPDKHTFLGGLGSTLRVRFKRLEQLSDLEDAISILRKAVKLAPQGHPENPIRLNNLGNALRIRFERVGELSDLEDAILMLRDAVDLTPHGHTAMARRLNNLGISVSSRFERLKELSDLENAISIHKDAVDLTPHGDPEKPSHLISLGNSLKARFEYSGDLSDLENAISSYKSAVDLTPHGHPEKSMCLSSLGTSLLIRSIRLRRLSDLEDAIVMHRDAVDLTPHGHPEKPGRLIHLAASFVARCKCLGELRDLETAIYHYSHAASAPVGPINVRFIASQEWISCARYMHHHSLLHAYSVGISLLPQLAWIGLSLAHRYSELKQGADIVREAAAVALDLGFPEAAVEWLEQGRSIVWGELLQLRSAYEELLSTHPDHARRLRELSLALEHASTAREKSLSSLSEGSRGAAHPPPESLQQEADRHRALAIERDTLLQDIRRLPGFERFLLQKKFSHLRTSAHSGPVVILNAAKSRCDALIVLANVDHVIHVPLSNFTLERSTRLQHIMKSFLRRARVMRDDRVGKTEPIEGVSWETFLAPLWKSVVKPVLDALAFSNPGDLSRIFWCPTGLFAFLPFHAAGLYDLQYSQPGHKVYDFVVSSYVPTLSMLALSPNTTMVPSKDIRLLAVRQPPSDGLAHLGGVGIELEHIRNLVGKSPSACTTLLESSTGTVEEVLGLMKMADWVHFACHGIQDVATPVNSGLCLADQRRLKISDIIALSRPRGGLAFLSACQTATGDEDLSDEAIHIAAGMLFAGYGGVIGTMWSISDRLAPEVAWDVYEQLFRDGTRPDYREAARALHDAIGRLRDSEEVPFSEWIPFIHVGL